MHLIRFIEAAKEQADADEVEYRLVCSGELYNRRVQTFDWQKTYTARILLEQPIFLLVTSQPFDSYPQELCARLRVGLVTERAGSGSVNYSRSYHPDADIIEDICAVLTLLSRRLISPVVKTYHTPGSELRLSKAHVPSPLPIVGKCNVKAWRQRPVTIRTDSNGQTVFFNTPPPVGVDDDVLAEFITKLVTREDAQAVIYAARQYKTALELIEERPETSYLALISVIETLANIALAGYEPDESEKIAGKHNLVKLAKKLGLTEPQAHEIALEASRGNPWSKRKFVKFCKEYCPPSEISGDDPVFIVPDFLRPDTSDYEASLGRIYQTRSGSVHSAVPFPPGSGLGTSPWLPVSGLPLDLLAKPEVPPVTWFERVVSIAAQRFILSGDANAFVELRAPEASSGD